MFFVKRNVWLGLELAFSQKGCGKLFLLAHQGDTTVATEWSSTFSLLWSSFKSLKVILYWTVFQTVFWIEVFLCVIDNIQKRCVYSEDFNWRLQFCIVDLIKLVIFAENCQFVVLPSIGTEIEKTWASAFIVVHIGLFVFSTWGQIPFILLNEKRSMWKAFGFSSFILLNKIHLLPNFHSNIQGSSTESAGLGRYNWEQHLVYNLMKKEGCAVEMYFFWSRWISEWNLARIS